ncbi:FYVE and coiled-coil domain-containing protein 1 [Frankliniella fusca]|uniref:FYVE and coiled-coil domain-containing protein 1 n=1 Tax=Frankliniella fusca TaxID=407009 RepID=A0AAE1HLP6_9NEOP|nr:FYVE and coiled-coil domain-containing protein 1 [Frankliniella fusca]
MHKYKYILLFFFEYVDIGYIGYNLQGTMVYACIFHLEHEVAECPGSGPGSAGSSSPSPCSSLGSSPGPGAQGGHGALAIFSFALPAKQAKLTYKEQQKAIRAGLGGAPALASGSTLTTLEKGVLFPVVHISDSGAFFQRYLDTGHLLAEDALGPDFALHQGSYQEVRCIAPEGAELAAPPLDAPGPARDYLLLGFKGVDESFGQVLEDSWKDWTGARHIYLFLPDVLGLERISLYRRIEPDSMQLFKYLVLARLGPAPDDGPASKAQELLLDYAQRLRVHRISAYLSVYRSEPSGSSSSPSATWTA